MKLYVPDSQKWLDFFERLSTGKTSLNQTGTGRRHSVIPIEESKASRERNRVTIRAVLPSEQTTARAESELKREGIKPDDVVDALQSKRGKRKRKISKTKKVSKKRPVKRVRNLKKDIFEIK